MPNASTPTNHHNISFGNTAIAFKSKSDQDLKRSYWLFRLIGFNLLVKLGQPFLYLALAIKLPVKGIIKKTIFKQFCGGESIQDCKGTIDLLDKYNVGTILDYSVEGTDTEIGFEHTTSEIIHTVEQSHKNPKIPFCVFKITGIGRFQLLAKINNTESLTDDEQQELKKVETRLDLICKTAYDKKVRIFIDAEETWIQNTIDQMASQMMERYNKDTSIVYNTIQLYRHDRLAFLKTAYETAKTSGYYLGVKLVRGAYMEKERKRAIELNYPSPIQPDKISSDRDFNAALTFCIDHIDNIYLCAGSHNEDSSALLAKLIDEHKLTPNDERIYFSQLLGMSDHISFNLANAGYNVAKYVPYGPVKAVMPYLMRRAQENTSVKGQMGRELQLIQQELKRRRT